MAGCCEHGDELSCSIEFRHLLLAEDILTTRESSAA